MCLLFVFKEKKVRHKLIIFLIYPLPFSSIVLLDNEKNYFFISWTFCIFFFFMNIEKNNSVLCINNNEYIFLLIITCLKFLLDYDQLFFSIIYKKGILIKNERIN